MGLLNISSDITRNVSQQMEWPATDSYRKHNFGFVVFLTQKPHIIVTVNYYRLSEMGILGRNVGVCLVNYTSLTITLEDMTSCGKR